MKHADGFIGWWPLAVLNFLDSESPPQFYRLGGWGQLFTRCDCCELNHEAAYEPITADEAREWAEGRINA